MKLSKEQNRVLNQMESGKWYSAYRLRCRMSTLQALQGRGLVKSKGWREPGAFSMEYTHIQWIKENIEANQ